MSLLRYVVDNSEGYEDLRKFIPDERIIKILLQNNISTLRTIQKDAITSGLFFSKNFLICTPSGSGKTLIGELAIAHNFFTGLGKGIYLVPYRAIASEKYKYFAENYTNEGLKVALSVGDYDSEESEIFDADLLITTFEKLDSILRNNKKKIEWLNTIASIVIDEVHVMGDRHRGFKLESLMIRLFRNIYQTQVICLSATISNPENFCGWLNYISRRNCNQEFYLISSDERPVELDYQITVNKNKDSFIRSKINKCLEEKGQLLLFINTRKGTIKNAEKFRKTTKRALDELSKNQIDIAVRKLRRIRGSSGKLRSLIQDGIAYHNAGLLSKERAVIERLYANRHIKVICCTTTLAAGVNTPARMVILRNFKQRTLNRHNYEDRLPDGTQRDDIYEMPGSSYSHFIPYSNNQVFQLLGRAGRPGLDLKGIGIIPVKNQAELEWVEMHYFCKEKNGKLCPKYSPIKSAFNKIGALREQLLLLAHEHNGISKQGLTEFFKNSYYSFNYECGAPLERYLLIDSLDTQTALMFHTDEKSATKLAGKIKHLEITKLSGESMNAIIRMHTRYSVTFDIEKGVNCSCGYSMNPEKLRESHNIRNNYRFCDHIIAFLSYVYSRGEAVILKYLDEILPAALKTERILDFLVRTGFVVSREAESDVESESDPNFIPTPLGRLTIQLYLRPIDMISLRSLLLEQPLLSQISVVEVAFEYLKNQGRFRSMDFFTAIKDWLNEVPVDFILERTEYITAGDFFAFKDGVVRTMNHIEAVSRFFDRDDVAEMAQTLTMRLEHGVREELLDLVVRISGVGRYRGRKLYDLGYQTVMDIYESSPQQIEEKTGLRSHVVQQIYDNSIRIKEQNERLI